MSALSEEQFAIAALRNKLREVEALNARLLSDLSEANRRRGEAEGMLAVSELPGVVDGWRERAETAEAENERLVKERDDWKQRWANETTARAEAGGEALKAHWRAATAEARAAELERKVGEMTEALRPFATCAGRLVGGDDFAMMAWHPGPKVTIGHFRRAAALCEPEGGA